jgi:hypothetical protein
VVPYNDLLNPRFIILTIINSHRFFCYHKGQSINHYGQLMCFLMTNASSLQVQDRAESLLGVVWYGPVRYYFYSWNHRQHNTIPHHYLHYYDCRSRNWFWMVIIHPWHKEQITKQMFQMFDAPVAVDGHALLLVQNYEC